MKTFSSAEVQAIKALTDVIVTSLAQGSWQDLVKKEKHLRARKIESFDGLLEEVSKLTLGYLENQLLNRHGQIGNGTNKSAVRHLLSAVAKIKIEEDKIII